MMLKSAELNDLYMASGDARALRGDEDTHGSRWERLNNLASILGAEEMLLVLVDPEDLRDVSQGDGASGNTARVARCRL